MANPPLTTTHLSEVADDQIDELGHMNVRWYAHNAWAATAALLSRLGLGAPQVVSAYTRHHHEQLLGNRLEVHSGVLGGSRRLRLYHEFRNAADGDLAATFVHELDHPPVEAPSIDLPDHGRPRSIDIDTDAFATAPTLDAAIDADLAIRHPRAIDADDTGGAASVPAWRVPSLFWGGDHIDGTGEWIRSGPDGQRLASATMEFARVDRPAARRGNAHPELRRAGGDRREGDPPCALGVRSRRAWTARGDGDGQHRVRSRRPTGDRHPRR